MPVPKVGHIRRLVHFATDAVANELTHHAVAVAFGQLLHSAHANQDWTRYARLLNQLIDKYLRQTLELPALVGGSGVAVFFAAMAAGRP